MKRVYGPTTVISSTAATVSTSAVVDLAAINPDTVVIQSVYTDAAPAAKTFDTGVVEVTAITCAADTGVLEIQTLTLPTFAGATDRDYIIVENAAGTKYAVYADKTGTSIAPTGALYVAATYKVRADISTDTTAAQVAARFETAFNSLTGFTTSITSNDVAADGTMTLTQVQFGATVNPVPKNLDDSGAGSIAGVQTTGGVASIYNSKYFTIYSALDAIAYYVWFNVGSTGVDPTPASKTGVSVAITAAATANAVADAVALALDGLAAFVAPNPAGAVVTCTNATVGAATDAANVNVGTGFSIAITTPGVTEEVDIATEVLSIPAHGFTTGLKVQLTTTVTLPGGLNLATDYFVIAASASTITLATSLVLANAGTAINITTTGTGVHTITPVALSGGTIKLQASLDGTTYKDLASQTVTVSAAGNELFYVSDPGYDYLRILFTPVSGSVGLTVKVTCKRRNFPVDG